MSYTIWLSKDGKEWHPLPQPNTRTTHYPQSFADLLKAETRANEVLCDGEYTFAQVCDQVGNVVSEVRCIE